MRKLWSFSSCMLFLCLLFSGLPEVKSQNLKNSVLWKISGNGLEQPSYLFGTVHIMDSAYYSLHSTVREKIDASDIMVFEINISDPAYQQKALAQSYMTNDSLENILSEEEYKEIQKFTMDEFGFPLSAIHKMKPFYIASVFNALSLPKNTMSYEKELQDIALESNMEVTGISTMDKESEILDLMDMETQKQSLFDAIEEYKKGYPQREQVFQAYHKADLNSIYDLMRKDFSLADSLVYDIMFVKRHEVWLPSMLAMMEEQSCFFAVGVGHLPGEAGLIKLLRLEGFRVKPVNMDFKLY